MAKKEYKRPDETVLHTIIKHNRGTAAELIITLAWKTGLTREEMYQLTWENVSFYDSTLYLSDREVPMEESVCLLLQGRFQLRQGVPKYVVVSDRNRHRMTPQSMSRCARIALDAGGLTDINLVDLRHDFIIRMLQGHDLRYTAKVTGLSLTTFYANFPQFIPRRNAEGEKERPATPEVNEFKLWKIIQAEDDSPVGLALWMSYKYGMSMKEAIDLTWDRVDLDEGYIYLPDKEIRIDAAFEKRLRRVRDSRLPDADPHVLLTPKSQRPFDHARLSRVVQTVLIRGGLENLSLRDIQRGEEKDAKASQILYWADVNGSVTRSSVMKLLQITKSQAYNELNKLTGSGKLVLVGTKYYPAGKVVPPEEHYEAIRKYLKANDMAYRQDLASLLHVDGRQCYRILRNMVQEGKLVKIGQQYALPENEKSSIFHKHYKGITP